MTDSFYQPDDEWWQPAPDYVPPRNGQPARITIRANPGQGDVAQLVNNSLTPAPQNPLQLLTQGGQEPAPQNALEQRGIVDKLLGLSGPRYQTWPEKMVQSAVTLPEQVFSGQVPVVDPATGHTAEPVIQRVQDLAGMMGGGSMPASVKGALGAAGGRMMQPDAVAPVFYSGVERALEGISQKTATGDQWLNTLRNRPGVKPEELEWTGVQDFLGSKAGEKVSKDDLSAYVKEHQTQVQEVERGEGVNPSRLAEMRKEFEEAYGTEEPISDAELINEYQALYGEEPSGTKFDKYQLPGGDNYRELLLTLPLKTKLRPARNFNDWLDKIYRKKLSDFPESDHEKLRQLYDVNEKNFTHNDPVNYFASSHWDEPNVLAHVRMNDRQIPDVGKSLHLEEIQSDWHQAGKKQGYKNADPKEVEAAQEMMNNTRSALQDHLQKMGLSGDEVQSALAAARSERIPSWVLGDPKNEHLATDFIDAQRHFHDVNKTTGVPDAPFKSTWADLALKRAISKAAREGYDSISWTPGEQQAARYDLSKQIDELLVNKNKDGTFSIDATLPGNRGNHHLGKSIPLEKLPDLVGKEMAEKISKQEIGSDVYNADDLKVGGEGMKAFYDKMLVDKANKLAKSMGGKVEWKEIPDPAINVDRATWDSHPPEVKAQLLKAVGKSSNMMKIPVLKMTPAMKQAAGSGFPLYAKGLPFTFTPVDHDPFKDTQFNDKLRKGNAT